MKAEFKTSKMWYLLAFLTGISVGFIIGVLITKYLFI